MEKKTYCYIGNWGKDNPSIGYTLCEYHADTGELTAIESEFAGLSVGAHCVDREKLILYTADEKTDTPGMRHGGGGEVYAFLVNPETGKLSLINSQPSFGVLTSYVALDPKGEFLVATNHGSRSYVTHVEQDEDGKWTRKVLYDHSTVALYPLMEDGSIGEVCDVFVAQGEGPAPAQFAPHLHSVNFAPDGSFFLVCDKGSDYVYTFFIDREKKKMVQTPGSPFSAEAGSEPRYSVFHPQKRFVYTNSELTPILYGFQYEEGGKLTPIEMCSGYAFPCENQEKGAESAVLIGKDGKYLYSLIRGTNTISVFGIDQETGILTPIQQYFPGADNLRGGTVSLDGKYLMVAAIDSHEVLSCPILEDGRLGEAAFRLPQPTPCCIAFV